MKFFVSVTKQSRLVVASQSLNKLGNQCEWSNPTAFHWHSHFTDGQTELRWRATAVAAVVRKNWHVNVNIDCCSFLLVGIQGQNHRASIVFFCQKIAAAFLLSQLTTFPVPW